MIEFNGSKSRMEECSELPSMCLASALVTDNRPGYDHITAPSAPAAGGLAGHGMLCYVTPKENTWACPTRRRARGLIGLQDRPAHAADSPATARRRDRADELSRAATLSTGTSSSILSLESETRAREYHDETLPADILQRKPNSLNVGAQRLPDADQDHRMRIWPVGRRAEGPGGSPKAVAVCVMF